MSAIGPTGSPESPPGATTTRTWATSRRAAIGHPDPLGGLDCAHPPLNGPDNTNLASPATATEPADQYATRHNGFMYFHSIIDNTAECDANVVPLGRVAVGSPSRFDGTRLPDTFSGHLVDDLRQEWTTPRFGWITPNLCDDGHDSTCAGPNTIGQTGAGAGGLHGADEFLAHWMPLLMASPAYRSGQMLIVVTFDEAELGRCQRLLRRDPRAGQPDSWLLLAARADLCAVRPADPQSGSGRRRGRRGSARSALIRPGSVDTSGEYNHYSALRSYEDLLGITRGGTDGLGHLGFAGAPGLTPFGPDVFNRDTGRGPGW